MSNDPRERTLPCPECNHVIKFHRVNVHDNFLVTRCSFTSCPFYYREQEDGKPDWCRLHNRLNDCMTDQSIIPKSKPIKDGRYPAMCPLYGNVIDVHAQEVNY